MTPDEQLRKPSVSLAKIGKRYYWTVWRFTDHLEEGDGGTICIRLADGFTDTREDAASAALAEIERIEPGLIERQLADWEKGWGSTHKFRAIVQRHRHESRAWAFVLNSEGITARALHRVHHVKPKAAKHCHAQADLGLIYTWVDNSDSDQFRPYWQEHRITKITLKRIFIHQHLNNSQTSLPREILEHGGEYRPRGHGWWQSTYYTEAGKRREDEARAEQARQFRRDRNSGVASEHATLLGLGAEFTRADVMRAFRQQEQEHHPDKGGDPAKFRALVMAKDRALALAA
jgi:hypothetical protein